MTRYHRLSTHPTDCRIVASGSFADEDSADRGLRGAGFLMSEADFWVWGWKRVLRFKGYRCEQAESLERMAAGQIYTRVDTQRRGKG